MKPLMKTSILFAAFTLYSVTAIPQISASELKTTVKVLVELTDKAFDENNTEELILYVAAFKAVTKNQGRNNSLKAANDYFEQVVQSNQEELKRYCIVLGEIPYDCSFVHQETPSDPLGRYRPQQQGNAGTVMTPTPTGKAAVQQLELKNLFWKTYDGQLTYQSLSKSEKKALTKMGKTITKMKKKRVLRENNKTKSRSNSSGRN